MSVEPSESLQQFACRRRCALPLEFLRPLINPVIPSVLAISIRATAKPNAVGWDKIWFYLAKQRKGDQLWNSRE
jgi:hypothetical protein